MLRRLTENDPDAPPTDRVESSGDGAPLADPVAGLGEPAPAVRSVKGGFSFSRDDFEDDFEDDPDDAFEGDPAYAEEEGYEVDLALAQRESEIDAQLARVARLNGELEERSRELARREAELAGRTESPTPTSYRFAADADDVLDGMPFVGRLFRVLDDGTRRFVESYEEHSAVAVEDVMRRKGSGTYLLKTMSASGEPVEFTFSVGDPPPAPGGRPPATVVSDADELRIERAVRARLEEEFYGRLKDAEDRVARARDDVRDAREDAKEAARRCNTAQSDLAAVRSELTNQIIQKEQVVAEVRRTALDEREAMQKAHYRELERLRNELRETQSELDITRERLEATERGEGGMGVMGDLLGRFAESGLIERLISVPTASGGFPSAGLGSVPGHDGSEFGPPVPVQNPQPLEDRVRSQQPLNPVQQFLSQAATLAVNAALGNVGVDPATLKQHIDAGVAQLRLQGIGVSMGDWQALAQTLLAHAIEHQIDPVRVAGYLAPLAAPAEDLLRGLFLLPGNTGLGAILRMAPVDLPDQALPYIERIYDALRQVMTQGVPSGATTPSDDHSGDGAADPSTVAPGFKAPGFAFPDEEVSGA